MTTSEQWLVECYQFACASGTKDDFLRCVASVTDRLSAGNPHWIRPMCQHTPTAIEWQGTRMYGNIAYHQAYGWSINT